MAGRIPQTFIDDLLDRVDIVDVVDRNTLDLFTVEAEGRQVRVCLELKMNFLVPFLEQNQSFIKNIVEVVQAWIAGRHACKA